MSEISFSAEEKAHIVRKIQLYFDQELKQQIMVNAADFSGTGYVQDVPRLVTTHGAGLDEAGLKALLQRAYDAEFDAVSKRLEETMRVN